MDTYGTPTRGTTMSNVTTALGSIERGPSVSLDVSPTEQGPFRGSNHDIMFGTFHNAEPGDSERWGIKLIRDEAGNPTGCNYAIHRGPSVKVVDLCIFDENEEAVKRYRLSADPDRSGVFTGVIPGMKPGSIYGVRSYSDEPSAENPVSYYSLQVDPYARAMTGQLVGVDDHGEIPPAIRDGIGATWGEYRGQAQIDSAPFIPKCVVVDESSYDWGEDRRPQIPSGERVIYEAHIKGMTALNPDIPEALRGTYAGFAHPANIDHLLELGITSVELLPPQQFVSEPTHQQKGRVNYWGYNTIGFFAPHGAYASPGDEPGRQVREFKDMVKALHAAGIEVIIDVVYNHTAESGNDGYPFLFKGAGEAADFYHIERRGKGTVHYPNLAGVGNAVNGTSPKAKQFILDSLRYWAEEMHVDGFRFDLASELARKNDAKRTVDIHNTDGIIKMITEDRVLSERTLIAEAWDCGGEGSYQVGNFLAGWSDWNGGFRDAVRDFWCSQAVAAELAQVLAGGTHPNDSKPIDFITAHDGQTLQDLVSYNGKHNEANGEGNRDGENHNRSHNHGVEGPTEDPDIIAARERKKRALALTGLVAAGIPMISHGDELSRTQKGNNNAYCQDNEMTWVDWRSSDLPPEESQRRTDFLNYVRGIIRTRRDRPDVFARPTPLKSDDNPPGVRWHHRSGEPMGDDPGRWSDKVLMMRRTGVVGAGRTAVREIVFTANGSNEPAEIRLPHDISEGSLRIIVDTQDGIVYPDGGPTLAGRSFTLHPGSAILMERIIDPAATPGNM